MRNTSGTYAIQPYLTNLEHHKLHRAFTSITWSNRPQGHPCGPPALQASDAAQEAHLASDSAVQFKHVLHCCLKMAGGVVALADKALVSLPTL